MTSIILFELKENLKSMIIWPLALFILIFASQSKYDTLIKAPEETVALMDSLPNLIKVIYGIGNLDITALDGYFAVVFLYVIIALAIFAAQLGAKTIEHEESYLTSDFLFTRPLSRVKIYYSKLISQLITFTIVYFIVCLGSYLFLLKYDDIAFLGKLIISGYPLILFFFSIGMFLSALKLNHHASLIASSLVFVFFLIKVSFDILEKSANYFTPFYAFAPDLVIINGLNVLHIFYYLVISIILIISGSFILNSRDLY